MTKSLIATAPIPVRMSARQGPRRCWRHCGTGLVQNEIRNQHANTMGRMLFPEDTNSHLVNLMTIARHDATPESCAAVQNELLHGKALLLVAARPAEEGGRGVTFTHAPTIDGLVTLYAFTGQAALRTFAKEDLSLMVFPAGAFFRSCINNGVGAVVVDPHTANELRIRLAGPQD